MNDIQQGLLEMMVDIDAVLRKHGVQYTLDGGTAIGAVREGGFIPWDDDADIAVFGDQLDGFREAVADLPAGKYFLQDMLSVDWANTFFKIRMNGTAAIEEGRLGTRAHQGLFVDVFVIRRYPDTKARRALYRALLACQAKVRGLTFRTYGKPRMDPVQRFLDGINRSLSGMMAGVSGDSKNLR